MRKQIEQMRADHLKAPILDGLAECGADVFLAGHMHVSSVISSAERYKMPSGYNALVIQAGTAASTRGRGEANSFNLLEFENPTLTVHRLECAVPSEGFRAAALERFTQSGVGWTPDVGKS